VAAETAKLWVTRAAELAEQDDGRDPGQVIAYVNLARSAVERAGLDVLELVHRSVGLAGFLRTHPIERLSRDLATYLRQPAPDRALTTAAGYVLGRDTPSADLWL
jgi:alkylation response protein AidB-like acyl-CoA dehydrogenase